LARVRVRGTRQLRIAIESEINRLIDDPRLQGQIGQLITRRMRAEARLSRNIRTGRSLPTLSPSYRARRSRLSRGSSIGRGLTTDSRFFRPNTSVSNLTLSGQFLRSLRYTPIRSGRNRGEVVVAASGRRREGLTNAQVINFLIDRDEDYNIFGLDDRSIQRIRNLVTRELRRRLRTQRGR